jgi:cytochrome c biogenesis protein CcmG/thiol:disulfide interchange protein DsbE
VNNKWIWLPVVLFALLLAGFAVAVVSGKKPGFSDRVGQTVGSLDLPTLDGSYVELFKTKLQNQMLVVNFFASWCAPCKAEHPYLMRLYKDHNATIVGVSFKDDKVKSQAMLKQLGNPYMLTLLDEKGMAGLSWGLTGVPETYVVDPEGIIRFHQAGPLTESAVQEIVKLVERKE